MSLIVERIVELEAALEDVITAFEAVDAPPSDVEDDLPALYSRLHLRLARAAQLLRGTCQCGRFGLRRCICVQEAVQ